MFREHRDAGNPATTARAHNAQGADELLVLDIDAMREGRGPDPSTIEAIADEVQIPLTVGGGITSREIARRCMEAGADKLCLTSTALDTPDLITELAEFLGSQAIMLGVDVVEANGAYQLYDHRAARAIPDRHWLDWLHEGVDRGAGEIKLTAVSREGMRTGFDMVLHDAAREKVNTPIILDGGAGRLEHLSSALADGADALALGTMLVFSDNNIVKLKRYLAGTGCDIRI